MPSSLLTNLNSAFSLSFPRAVRAKETRNLVKALTSHSSRHCDNSRMTAAAAAAASGTAAGDFVVDSLVSSSCGNVSGFAKPSGVYFGDKRIWSCRRGNLSMTSVGNRSRSRSRSSRVANGNGSCFVFDVTRRCGDNGSVVGLWLSGVGGGGNGNVSMRCYSEGVVPEVSNADDSSSVDQLGGLAVSDEQGTLGDRALKLLSGSCYLPHPDKEKTGGEDAHFICTEEQVIGVADGVGGWADQGINAGDYARELMSNSVNAIRHEPKGLIDLARVLEKAYQWTTNKGSSTACIIALTEQGLHAINLGDSGFIVVRDGRTIFESPVQQHGFNFPYQLESGNRADTPSSGQVFTIPVAPGDVIVAGTDGLFDNLFNNEVSSTVAHAVLAGLTPDATAQKIAALARQRALDRQRQTPFSAGAQEAGFHYYGGKLDDITVVVSYITS